MPKWLNEVFIIVTSYRSFIVYQSYLSCIDVAAILTCLRSICPTTGWVIICNAIIYVSLCFSWLYLLSGALFAYCLYFGKYKMLHHSDACETRGSCSKIFPYILAYVWLLNTYVLITLLSTYCQLYRLFIVSDENLLCNHALFWEVINYGMCTLRRLSHSSRSEDRSIRYTRVSVSTVCVSIRMQWWYRTRGIGWRRRGRS